MSNDAITAVLSRSQSKGSARLIMIILADYANEDGTAWPSASTLAVKSNMSKRNVMTTLSKLEKSGELKRLGSGVRGVVKYHITVVTSELCSTYEDQFTSEDQFIGASEDRFIGTSEDHCTQPLTNPLLEPSLSISEKIENSKNGKRLSEDWKPCLDDKKYASARNWSEAEIADDVENFIEHFTNGPGRKQTSPDWSKRWQRWVRTNYGKNGTNGSTPPSGLTDEQKRAAFGKDAVI